MTSLLVCATALAALPPSATLFELGGAAVYAAPAALPEAAGCIAASVPAGLEPYALFLDHVDSDPARIPAVYSLGIPPVDGDVFVVAAPAKALEQLVADTRATGAQWLAPMRSAGKAAVAAGVFAAADATPVARDVKDEVVNAMSVAGLDALLQGLCGNGTVVINGNEYLIETRRTGTEGNDQSAIYMAGLLEQFGYDVELQPFTVQGEATNNVLAKRIGTLYPEQEVVIGAHFDSVSGLSSREYAPGCEDNASATADVILLAEALAKYAFEYTVTFALWSGEEQGLLGSRHFVDEAVAEGRTFVAALNGDMVAYHNVERGVYGANIFGYNNDVSLPLMDFTLAEFEAVSPGLDSRTNTGSYGSDCIPFNSAGIPSVCVVDRDYGIYPFYHTTRDTIDEINFALGLDILRGWAAATVELVRPF